MKANKRKYFNQLKTEIKNWMIYNNLNQIKLKGTLMKKSC